MMNPDGMPSPIIGYEPRRIVIKFDPTALGRLNRLLTPAGRTGIPAVDEVARNFGAVTIKRQFPGARKRFWRGREIDLSGWHIIQFQTDVDIDKVVAAFKGVNGIIDAQQIGIHAVYQMPNDPSLVDQWHLNQSSDRDIDAPEAWDYETGNAEIIVAVIDSGVRWFHWDLGGSDAVFYEPTGFSDNISHLHGADGNMWINGAEANGVFGVDDDGNGFADDMIGWDFVDIPPLFALLLCHSYEDCLATDNDPRDFQGHGTHVAGIIGALNNNDYAVSSPAGGWGQGNFGPAGNGVKIMALRAGWADNTAPIDGGPLGYVNMTFVAQALKYAADNGARIANASWGSSDSGGLGEAVDYFLAAGGLIFHAAGNGSVSSADYLGSRGDVLNVAATDQGDCKTSFSYYGSWVDIAAPGLYILSTWHEYANPSADYIAWLSGTSMASPAAASVAALIWSQNPLWTAEQVKLKLLDSTDYIDDLQCNSGFVGQLGSGRVNAYLAVGSCEGDFGGKGVVDGSDLADLVNAYGCTSDCSPYDVTYDGIVDSGDVDVFVKDYGRTGCPGSTTTP